jgi:hypothetical protein
LNAILKLVQAMPSGKSTALTEGIKAIIPPVRSFHKSLVRNGPRCRKTAAKWVN